MTINNGHLNAEEYRALRKVLGFSQQEAQNFHGLKNIRTIQQWEKGNNTTSACACQKILSLMHTTAEYIKDKFFEFRQHRSQPAIFLSYNDNEDFKYIAPIIKEFNTLSVYKMAVYRAYVEALSRNFDAHIVIFNKEDFESYLVALNVEDSLQTRENWARLHYLKYKRL